MRLATWNINLLMVGLPRLPDWPGKHRPDVFACRKRRSRTVISQSGNPGPWLSAALHQADNLQRGGLLRRTACGEANCHRLPTRGSLSIARISEAAGWHTPTLCAAAAEMLE